MASNYSIASAFASGGWGTVALGQDNITGSPVAIKTVEAARFSFAEIEALERVTSGPCRHAVHLRGHFETGDTHTIVMDYANGRDIFTTFLEPGIELEYEELKSIVFQALEFLVDCAKKGITHTDLKPENMIWLPDSRTLKIIDMGAARCKGSKYIPQTGGTLRYASPDVILGKPSSPSIDLWSLGVVIYVLFTKSHLVPFDQDLKGLDAFQMTLQVILRRLGALPLEFLHDCKWAHLFFNQQGDLRRQVPLPDYEDWQETFLAALDEHGVSEEEKELWLELVYRLTSYEERGTAEEHLQNPLFKAETHFNFAYNRAIKCRVFITRASLLEKPFDQVGRADLLAPDLYLNLKKYKGDCLHIPRDRHNQYLIFLEKNGLTYKTIGTIVSGCLVDIKKDQEFVCAAPRLAPLRLKWGGEEEHLPKRARSVPRQEHEELEIERASSI